MQQAVPGEGDAGIRRAGEAEVLLIIPREAEEGAGSGYAQQGEHDSPEAPGYIQPVSSKAVMFWSQRLKMPKAEYTQVVQVSVRASLRIWSGPSK